MDTSYVNHIEVSPRIVPRDYQDEVPRFNMCHDEPLNHIGPTHYSRVGDIHNPILYRPLPAFPHLGGYTTNLDQSYTLDAMMNATNFMSYGQQFNYIHHPQFHRDFVRFENNMPVAYHSQDGGGLVGGNFMGDAVQAGFLQNPEQFDGSLLQLGFGGYKHAGHQYNIYSRRIPYNNEGGPPAHSYFCHCSPANANFSSLGCNMVDGYLSPGYNMGGWTWTNINGGINHGIYPKTSSSQFVPMPQGCLQDYFPMPNDWILGEGGDRGDEDARYINEDPYSCPQISVAASKSFSWSQAGLPNKNEVGLSKMDSSYGSGVKIPNERNSSQRQHGYKNKVGTSPTPTKSSMVSPTVRALESKKQSGQTGQGQRSKPTQSGKDPALPVESSGIQETSASKDPAPSIKRSEIKKTSPARQVWRKKTKAQPSSSRSKLSSKRTSPIYHITWNGPDEQCEPVGQNCHLCEEDLSYAPTDDESEYYDVFEHPNLPDVAVLPCGHAFHSKCLQLITPEEQSSDPPCYLCSSW